MGMVAGGAAHGTLIWFACATKSCSAHCWYQVRLSSARGEPAHTSCSTLKLINLSRRRLRFRSSEIPFGEMSIICSPNRARTKRPFSRLNSMVLDDNLPRPSYSDALYNRIVVGDHGSAAAHRAGVNPARTLHSDAAHTRERKLTHPRRGCERSAGNHRTAAISSSSTKVRLSSPRASLPPIPMAIRSPTVSATVQRDAGLFTIDPATGALRFTVAPDYEHPTSHIGENYYYKGEIVVSDGYLSDHFTSASASTMSTRGCSSRRSAARPRRRRRDREQPDRRTLPSTIPTTPRPISRSPAPTPRCSGSIPSPGRSISGPHPIMRRRRTRWRQRL